MATSAPSFTANHPEPSWSVPPSVAAARIDDTSLDVPRWLAGAIRLIALRTALAMGADAAVHLKLPAGAAPDAAATAALLHGALEGRSFDLVLCGRQATDAEDAAVGPMLAARLDRLADGNITAITSAPPTLEELFLRHYDESNGEETPA